MGKKKTLNERLNQRFAEYLGQFTTDEVIDSHAMVNRLVEEEMSAFEKFMVVLGPQDDSLRFQISDRIITALETSELAGSALAMVRETLKNIEHEFNRKIEAVSTTTFASIEERLAFIERSDSLLNKATREPGTLDYIERRLTQFIQLLESGEKSKSDAAKFFSKVNNLISGNNWCGQSEWAKRVRAEFLTKIQGRLSSEDVEERLKKPTKLRFHEFMRLQQQVNLLCIFYLGGWYAEYHAKKLAERGEQAPIVALSTLERYVAAMFRGIAQIEAFEFVTRIEGEHNRKNLDMTTDTINKFIPLFRMLFASGLCTDAKTVNHLLQHGFQCVELKDINRFIQLIKQLDPNKINALFLAFRAMPLKEYLQDYGTFNEDTVYMSILLYVRSVERRDIQGLSLALKGLHSSNVSEMARRLLDDRELRIFSENYRPYQTIETDALSEPDDRAMASCSTS